MMDDNVVVTNKAGEVTSLVFRDAVDLMRVVVLCSSIAMYRRSNGRIIPTRGMGITRMLSMASQYTGQKYKRSEIIRAEEDLKVWVEMMKSSLHYVEG